MTSRVNGDGFLDVVATVGTVIATSIASLLPLLIFWRHFQFLFFFHDDWLMLDRLDRLGVGHWLLEPFAGEGVFPLFKILWWTALRLTGGSYFGMILILWITHAAICLLFGWLLVQIGMRPSATAFALLTSGLAWTNFETLGWFMQWNALLSMFFLLAAWHFLLKGSHSNVAACIACLLAAALCSSRGMIAGAVLAVFVLVENAGRVRVRLCFLCLTPTVLLTAIAWLFAPHHQLDAAATLRYASEYLILNPLFYLLPFLRVKFEGGNLLIFGLIKIAVFVWAFRKSAPSARPLLWTLVALDLLLAASLGYARWQTGLPTTTSSRYQYIPLLCFGPMVGILLARLRPGSQIAIAFLCIVLLTLPWKRHIEQWSTARGKTIRTAIAQDDPEQSFDPSFTTAGRARELARRYGLH